MLVLQKSADASRDGHTLSFLVRGRKAAVEPKTKVFHCGGDRIGLGVSIFREAAAHTPVPFVHIVYPFPASIYR